MRKPLSRKSRTVLLSIALVLLVVLTAFWVLLAYVRVHQTTRYGYNVYNGYTATRYVAHRGESAKYFDNTQEAFITAGSNSFFYGVETDVRKTADGVWVCSHDDDPFLDKSIKISASKYDDIKFLPLDLSKAKASVDKTIDYTIASYELYLDIMKRFSKHALIEIKGSYTENELSPVLLMATEKLGIENVTMASFSLQSVEAITQLNAYVKTLAFCSDFFNAYCRAYMNRDVGANEKTMTKSLVRSAHENGGAVYVYTVSTKESAEKYTEMKVDFIITNGEFANE